MHFSGYASYFNTKDSENDIFAKDSFMPSVKDFMNHKTQCKLLFNHQGKSVGVVKTLYSDNIGLFVFGEISDKTPIGRRLIEQIKLFKINGLSVGYFVNSALQIGNSRVINAASLEEISIVQNPSNKMCRIIFKS